MHPGQNPPPSPRTPWVERASPVLGFWANRLARNHDGYRATVAARRPDAIAPRRACEARRRGRRRIRWPRRIPPDRRAPFPATTRRVARRAKRSGDRTSLLELEGAA